MNEAKAYIRAVDYVHVVHRPSIVNASIASAVEGHYGDVHRTDRTRGSVLWINPLMAQYFCFDLESVAQRMMYLPYITDTQSLHEVVSAIQRFRDQIPLRGWESIPV
jgi:hypothetical protein